MVLDLTAATPSAPSQKKHNACWHLQTPLNASGPSQNHVSSCQCLQTSADSWHSLTICLVVVHFDIREPPLFYTHLSSLSPLKFLWTQTQSQWGYIHFAHQLAGRQCRAVIGSHKLTQQKKVTIWKIWKLAYCWHAEILGMLKISVLSC